jgi:ketosteroid isomerase-like protein
VILRAVSVENVELVRRGFEAFAQGGPDAMSDSWAEDIDYRAVEGALDDHGPLQGKEAVLAYVQDWLDLFDDLKVEPIRFGLLGASRPAQPL